MTAESFQHCSFCGKNKDVVRKLIVGERVGICNECVTLCQDLLVEKDDDVAVPLTNRLDPTSTR